MSTTLDNSRLYDIKVTGKGLTRNVVEACSKVTFSSSMDQVTEMSLTLHDQMNLEMFRSGILSSGASISYNGWSLVARTMTVKRGVIGPELVVKAPSRFVEDLRGQTGGYSWGDWDVTAWVKAMASDIGMDSLVQPGLGRSTIVRAEPTDGGKAESSWDVMTNLAKEVGCWLFEYGNKLVMARPSWLIKTTWARNYWPLYFDDWFTYSDGMDGMPEYTSDPNQNPSETLSVGLVSSDADTVRPGDEVDLGGAGVGAAGGKWIVKSVAFPMTVAGSVKVSCVRPVDPAIPPPKEQGGNAASTGAAVAAVDGGAVDAWKASVIGRYIDFDGAYGAQCVDLVQHYAFNCVGGGLARGNGKDIWFNENSGAYTKLGRDATARKGDIACWDASWGGGYGHVAVVLADNGGTITTVTQNPGPPREQAFGKNGLIGYLRPNSFKPRTVGTGGPRQWAQI